jgi:hypothetical protein
MISNEGATTSSIIRITSSQANVSSLVCIDSKKEPHKQIEDLNQDQITSIRVLKGQAAIKEYG